jgi:hypothetical protein
MNGIIELIHTDVVWNAAIEAAACEIERSDALAPEEIEFWANKIRALKRLENLGPL